MTGLKGLFLALKRSVFITLVLVIISGISSASFADNQLSAQQRIALLDFEILLLRTEIALRNGERGVFLVNMYQLSQKPVPEKFRSRYEGLIHQQRLLNNLPEVELGFRAATVARDIVVLLPMSSGLAQASNAIVDEFNQAFANRRLHIVDTDLYHDVSELVRLVELFSPGLIIGPLERQKAEAFYQHNIQVPSISFSSLDSFGPYLRTPASNSAVYSQALKPMLSKLDVNTLIWLTDKSGFANNLMTEVETLYLHQGVSSQQIAHFNLEGGADTTLGLALGAGQSNVRYNWLQRTLGRNLHFEAYVRRDKHLLIGVLSQQQALQIKPLLNFYGRDITFLWIPSELPDINAFLSSQSSWQKTYAWFPAHFSQQLRSGLKNNSDGLEVGLFHALAESVVSLVNNADHSIPFQVSTDRYTLVVDESGKYHFLPTLFFLNQDRLRRTILDEIYQDPIGL